MKKRKESFQAEETNIDGPIYEGRTESRREEILPKGRGREAEGDHRGRTAFQKTATCSHKLRLEVLFFPSKPGVPWALPPPERKGCEGCSGDDRIFVRFGHRCNFQSPAIECAVPAAGEIRQEQRPCAIGIESRKGVQCRRPWRRVKGCS